MKKISQFCKIPGGILRIISRRLSWYWNTNGLARLIKAPWIRSWKLCIRDQPYLIMQNISNDTLHIARLQCAVKPSCAPRHANVGDGRSTIPCTFKHMTDVSYVHVSNHFFSGERRKLRVLSTGTNQCQVQRNYTKHGVKAIKSINFSSRSSNINRSGQVREIGLWWHHKHAKQIY